MELRPGGGNGEHTSHRHAVDRRREAVREKDEDRELLRGVREGCLEQESPSVKGRDWPGE